MFTPLCLTSRVILLVDNVGLPFLEVRTLTPQPKCIFVLLWSSSTARAEDSRKRKYPLFTIQLYRSQRIQISHRRSDTHLNTTIKHFEKKIIGSLGLLSTLVSQLRIRT